MFQKLLLLEVNNISKRFGGLRAVQNLSFFIKKKEILGLIGPNGAGKTTVFNIIAGVYKTNSGSIKLNNKDTTNLKPYQICKMGIARTFQVARPFGKLTVLDNVLTAALLYTNNINIARNEAEKIIETVGLIDKIYFLASNLTIADKKRLELARALATKPAIVLLDEVMSGLTPKETNEIVDIIKNIRNSGITFLVVEHVMQVIMSLADRIIVMNHGEKLTEGIPQEVVNNKMVIKAYLGDDYYEIA